MAMLENVKDSEIRIAITIQCENSLRMSTILLTISKPV